MNTVVEFGLLILAAVGFLLANGLFAVPIPAHSWTAAALAVVSGVAFVFVAWVGPAWEEEALETAR